MEIIQGEVVEEIPRPKPPKKSRSKWWLIPLFLILIRLCSGWAGAEKQAILNEYVGTPKVATPFWAATSTPRPVITVPNTVAPSTTYYLRTMVTPDDGSFVLEWYWEFKGSFDPETIRDMAEEFTGYVSGDGESTQGANYSTYDWEVTSITPINWPAQCFFEFSEGTITIYTSESNWFVCGQLSDVFGQEYQTP